MALEMRAAPRPVSARRSTPDGGAAPWAMVAADGLLATYWTRRRAATQPRSQLRSGRRGRIWYRIPESRQTSGGSRLTTVVTAGSGRLPVGPDRLEGANEGTEEARDGHLPDMLNRPVSACSASGA